MSTGRGAVIEHGRRRSDCKECGGSGGCEHGRVRSRCRECICEHGSAAAAASARTGGGAPSGTTVVAAHSERIACAASLKARLSNMLGSWRNAGSKSPPPATIWPRATERVVSVTCPTSVVCTCACVKQQQQREGSEHLGDTYSAVPGVAGCDPPPQTPKAVLSTRHAQASSVRPLSRVRRSGGAPCMGR